MLDLSVPEELIITAETLLTSLRDRINTIFTQSDNNNFKNILNERGIKKIGEKHEDLDKINPFPIPLLIIGSKYELFQVRKYIKLINFYNK